MTSNLKSRLVFQISTYDFLITLNQDQQIEQHLLETEIEIEECKKYLWNWEQSHRYKNQVTEISSSENPSQSISNDNPKTATNRSNLLYRRSFTGMRQGIDSLPRNYQTKIANCFSICVSNERYEEDCINGRIFQIVCKIFQS